MKNKEIIKLSYKTYELEKINDIYESIKCKCYTTEEEKTKKQELEKLIKEIKGE